MKSRGKGKDGRGNEAKKGKEKRGKGKNKEILSTPIESPEAIGEKDREVDVKEEDAPFELKGMKLNIERGSFVAIVGRVGSGKVGSTQWTFSFSFCSFWFFFQSSVLQSLIGEMRKAQGQVNNN